MYDMIIIILIITFYIHRRLREQTDNDVGDKGAEVQK